MPIRYVPFYPEPIEGQALLNNFTRTRRALTYRDNDKPAQRILRGMPLYEVDRVEQVGENPNGNLVIRGECLSACAYLKDKGIQVDLVYIDPPFASGANYAKKIYLRRNPRVAQTIEQAEQVLDDEELQAFEETMYGDIWTKEAYLNWMYENLMAIKSVMGRNASLYVHLDYHIGHYVKILLDEVFGEDNFQNEIVWKRTTSRAGSRFYNHIHDVIYFYTLDDEAVWNQQYVAYSAQYVEQMFKHSDPDGRRWRESPLTAPGKSAGSAGMTWRGIDPGAIGKGRHWSIPSYIRAQLSKDAQENTLIALDEMERMGRIVWPRQGKGIPNFKQYLDDLEGIELQSIWLDVNGSSETEYTTQKPESLLERIILSSSNPDMTVADFFGGSGVTAKVAHDLGRRFIHVDVGINSIQTTRDRLISAGASFDILEVRDGVALFRNPAQTMEKLAALIPGLGKVEGLAPFWAGAIQDGKDGTTPVYLPNLLDHREKLLDLPLLNRIVNEQIPDLPEPDGVKKVIVYYVDIEDEKKARDFLREYGNPPVEVELRDLKAILHEIVLNDEVEYTLTETADGWQVEITRFYSDRLAQKIDAHNPNRRLNAKGKKKARQIALEEAENGEEPAPASFAPIEISETGLELIELISLDCTAAEGVWHSDSEIKIDKKGYVIRNGKKTKEFWDGAVTSPAKPLRLKVRNIAGDETVVTLEQESQHAGITAE